MLPLGKIVGSVSTGVANTGPHFVVAEIKNEASSYTIPCGLSLKPALSKIRTRRLVPFGTVSASINNNSWVPGVHAKLLIKLPAPKGVFVVFEVSFDVVVLVATAS